MQTLISVPTGTFIAVPNGAFPLKDVLVAPTTKQIIAIMETFTEAERAFLNSLFKEGEVSHV